MTDTVGRLLAPVPPLTEAAVARHKRTALAKRSGELLTVYRVQLVEERTIAVPRREIGNSRHAAQVVCRYLDKPDREHFVVLLLDHRNALLGIHTAAVGCIDAVTVSPRSVFKAALLRNAEKLVVAHNHLSGDVTPSAQDRSLTRALARAGDSLHIELKDHVIVGRSPRQRFSFHDHGLI